EILSVRKKVGVEDVLQLLAAAGTYWTPTLGAGGFNDLLVRDEPERLDDSMFRAFAPEPCIERGRAGSFMRAVETRTLRGAWVDQLAGVRSAHRAGVRLLVGTDAFCHLSQSVGAEGSSLHWELEHFVSAGLTPLEVLQIATSGAAAALGS
ncbi:MAG: amidohydrolase family protein, partial [Deltaproteobacteria bacterium]|nr:amidohydrolase family protein [Deltaproteobacteria bacterium]